MKPCHPEGRIVCAAKDLNQHTGKLPKVFVSNIQSTSTYRVTTVMALADLYSCYCSLLEALWVPILDQPW